jgi:hypothetical protein
MKKVYSEKDILSSKTPEQYIERSLYAKISSSKSKLAKLWMEKTGFTVADIQYARNRHPYWKELKMRGNSDRYYKRLEEHDYSKSAGGPSRWNEKELAEFIKLNGKDKNGKYLTKDWELGKIFKRSIPSVQYLRRRLNLINEHASAKKLRLSAKQVIELLPTIGNEKNKTIKTKKK